MTDLSIMTLNLRNSARLNEFKTRSKSISSMVSWHDPDLIGVQELMDYMIPELPSLTETYSFFGSARKSAAPVNERCCILFKKQRFRKIAGETIWLSDTPKEPGSKFLGSAFPRIATSILLEDLESGKTIRMCNTHLDHVLPSIRRKQAEVIQTYLRNHLDGDLTIVTGDFNCPDLSEPLQVLESDDTLHLHDTTPSDPKSTIRNFIQSSTSHYRPIDHILVSDTMTVNKTEILSGLYMGTYPSDHSPILVETTY
ncbi:MAG: endonuclease/exonuclease/phosphatase family protein [Solobacterium sp.]|nr:endonuclease/exonuclease/phosphatase family protein [Solobacterium sp.]